MRKVLLPPLSLIVAAASLMAADPAWKSKPAAQWTEEDAKQILAASPWAKEITATVTRRLTEDQLREGGQMGQPQGVGNEGVDPKGSGEKVSLNVFTGPGGDDRSARSLPRPITDRKSTRLNSSHLGISYAVFCLKKKNNVTLTNDTPSALRFTTCPAFYTAVR